MDSRLPFDADVLARTPPEVLAFLVQLLDRIEKLERENAELRERLKRDSTNSSRPPSSGFVGQKRRPPVAPSGRRRGGQPGHARCVRPLVAPERLAETIDYKPDACRRCGHELTGNDPEPLRHQVAELPSIEPTVIEHRLHRLTCPQCRTRTTATLPSGVPAGAFGPRLQAVLALLSGGYRIGKRGVRQLAGDLFGLSLSLGMVAKLERQTAEALQAPMDELCGYIRTQHANIDETSWRESGGKAWLWVVVAPLVTVFTIAGSRGAAVARLLLGPAYRFVATCDRYRGYLWIDRCQLCWAHLRRDFQAMIDRGGPGQKIGEALLEQADQLFEWWHRVRDDTLTRGTFQTYLTGLRRAVGGLLERGVGCGCAKTAATCRDLLADEPCLWTFARVEGVEPTNNAAERALRHAVLWRKSSGGTDSAAGSRFAERLLSVVATCRQQGRHVLTTLTACLTDQQAPSLLPNPSAIPLAA
jgi:transposase